MPYPRGHKAKTRERIVERARLLFNKHGFASVSIDEIMAEVGLTRGGEPVKRAYRQVLEHIVGTLEKGFAGPETRRRALVVGVLCIGGMVVARAVDDAKLAHEIREASKELATSITAWNEARVEAAE